MVINVISTGVRHEVNMGQHHNLPFYTHFNGGVGEDAFVQLHLFSYHSQSVFHSH